MTTRRQSGPVPSFGSSWQGRPIGACALVPLVSSRNRSMRRGHQIEGGNLRVFGQLLKSRKSLMVWKLLM